MLSGKIKFLLLLMLSMFWLTACNQESTPEKMYIHLEEAVALENDFAEQQEPLVELEQQEKELYDQIIDLGFEEFDQIQELSQEAISLIEERADIIEVEKESIVAAKQEFDKIEPMIEEIEQEDVKNAAVNMSNTMNERYNAYNDLHDIYLQSIELDKELYEMLQTEDLQEAELKKHIESINESYDKVIEANNTFNTKTEEYNNQKQQFYSIAEIDVEYNEE